MLSRSLVDHYTASALHHHNHHLSSHLNQHLPGLSSPLPPPVDSSPSPCNPFLSGHPFFISKGVLAPLPGIHPNPSLVHQHQNQQSLTSYSLSGKHQLFASSPEAGSLSPSTDGDNSIIEPLVVRGEDIKVSRPLSSRTAIANTRSLDLNPCKTSSTGDISGGTSSESDYSGGKICDPDQSVRTTTGPDRGSSSVSKKQRLSKSVSSLF